MISVEKAREIILKNIFSIKKTELLNITASLNRISAIDVKAKEDIPPFNNSAMDGFAIRAKDSFGASRENPKILEVIEDVPTGYVAKRIVGPKQAIRIMTGAPMPGGADSVAMAEDTTEIASAPSALRNDTVAIFKEVKPGENVRYAGEDVRRGEVVIKKGSILKSGHIGMLASLGISKIKVYRRPKVAILATGDELLDIGDRLKPGKIRNSNTYSLYAQVIKTGGVPVILGIAKDRKKEIESKIKKGLNADMILVSGGISVGDYDFVKVVLADLGMDMKFWKVAMRPGKPLAFGIIKKTPVFGLPGNVVSSMIAFEEFVRPAILKTSGTNELFRFHLPAILKEDFQKKKGLRYFLRAVLENKNGLLFASLTGPQGSGILKSMVLANALMELPEDATQVCSGEEVRVTYLD